MFEYRHPPRPWEISFYAHFEYSIQPDSAFTNLSFLPIPKEVFLTKRKALPIGGMQQTTHFEIRERVVE